MLVVQWQNYTTILVSDGFGYFEMVKDSMDTVGAHFIHLHCALSNRLCWLYFNASLKGLLVIMTLMWTPAYFTFSTILAAVITEDSSPLIWASYWFLVVSVSIAEFILPKIYSASVCNSLFKYLFMVSILLPITLHGQFLVLLFKFFINC